MKFTWRESVLGSGEAHLSVVDDRGKAATICGTPFLTASRSADPNESKCCADCQRIWMSGEEIAFVGAGGEKLVVRAKCDPIMTGTTDAFEDVVEALRKTGACYVLMVAMQSDRKVHQWTNLPAFGHGAINAFEANLQGLCAEARQNREEIERRNGGD